MSHTLKNEEDFVSSSPLRVSLLCKQKTSSSAKSIQEILYPARIVTTSEDSSSNHVEAGSRKRRSSDDETSSSAEGQLSGRSVEDAVRDRVGCRPRSNSTDGELNLPQRGLCDERTVLESYRWRFDRCNVGCGKPKGFNNLGNTCYLNSTLQCLAHIPPFCQSLLTLSSSNSGNSPTNRGPSQGKKITLMLKNLFARAHASNGSAGSSIAPRLIVSAVFAIIQFWALFVYFLWKRRLDGCPRGHGVGCWRSN